MNLSIVNRSALARALGVSVPCVSNWIRRGRVPISRAPAVARLLGVPISVVCPELADLSGAVPVQAQPAAFQPQTAPAQAPVAPIPPPAGSGPAKVPPFSPHPSIPLQSTESNFNAYNNTEYDKDSHDTISQNIILSGRARAIKDTAQREPANSGKRDAPCQQKPGNSHQIPKEGPKTKENGPKTEKNASESQKTPGTPGFNPGMDVDKAFDAFWAAYPQKKRLGRPEASAVWKLLAMTGELPPLEGVFTRLWFHAASQDWQKEDGRFIPRPAAWLAEHQWNRMMKGEPDRITPSGDRAILEARIAAGDPQLKRPTPLDKPAQVQSPAPSAPPASNLAAGTSPSGAKNNRGAPTQAQTSEPPGNRQNPQPEPLKRTACGPTLADVIAEQERKQPQTPLPGSPWPERETLADLVARAQKTEAAKERLVQCIDDGLRRPPAAADLVFLPEPVIRHAVRYIAHRPDLEETVAEMARKAKEAASGTSTPQTSETGQTTRPATGPRGGQASPPPVSDPRPAPVPQASASPPSPASSPPDVAPSPSQPAPSLDGLSRKLSESIRPERTEWQKSAHSMGTAERAARIEAHLRATQPPPTE